MSVANCNIDAGIQKPLNVINCDVKSQTIFNAMNVYRNIGDETYQIQKPLNVINCNIKSPAIFNMINVINFNIDNETNQIQKPLNVMNCN